MPFIAELKHGSPRKLLFTMIGVLFVAVVYFAVDEFMLKAEPERVSIAREKSIVVLPFDNFDLEHKYFADGLWEELVGRLSRVPGLLVAGRISDCLPSEYRDCISREHGGKLISYALEGSVRHQGNQVRVTAQLVSSWDWSELWSQTYDRTLGNPFAIQEDVAKEIVSAVDIVIDEETRRRNQQAGAHNGDWFQLPEISATTH
jgi:TolB-like protein